MDDRSQPTLIHDSAGPPSAAGLGMLSTRVWLALGGLITLALLTLLFVGNQLQPDGQSTLTPTPTATRTVVTSTPTGTPEAPATSTPAPAPPSPTAPPPPTSTPWPTASPTSTEWPTSPPTETPTAAPTETPTPVVCPGNQVWNGAECACPPDTVWIAQSQWCTGN
jgi:hypothetical protein